MTGDTLVLTPDLLRAAYAAGVFPMADDRNAQDIGWYDPPRRGVMPIADMHIPRRLIRTLARSPYVVTFNRDFAGVMRGCAGDLPGMTVARPTTWINNDIIDVFCALHDAGDAQSVEVWQPQGDHLHLAGGTYGLTAGGAYFGESMFSRARDASKIALVYLTARLWRRGFTLFDAQFFNDHLAQFGMREITRAAYHRQLAAALRVQADFRGGVAYSPSSNDPGNSCRVGTVPDAPPETGSTGAMSTGSGRGTLSACSGVVSRAGAAGVCTLAGASSFVLSDGTLASGAVAGAFSAEYACASADVASFLQAISQTS